MLIKVRDKIVKQLSVTLVWEIENKVFHETVTVL